MVFTGNPSSTWTAISYGLGLIWRIGNGRSVRIWRDSWIPRDSYCKALTPRRNKRIHKVSELIADNGTWKVDVVRNFFYPIGADAILKIGLSRRLAEKSGMFSVRSAYRVALSNQHDQCDMANTSEYPDGQHPCWKKIWQASVPPKVKVFAWKAASGGLATEENKLRRNMRVTGRCRICDVEYDDVSHVLYKCPHAYSLWEEMRRVWSLPSDDDLLNHPSNCNATLSATDHCGDRLCYAC